MIETPAFGKYMSKDRFLSILSNFHIVDNRNEKCADVIGHDPLYKVRPFIKMLTNNFGNYSAERELAFVEGTCPFKGRLKFKVYNPAKPNKFGIKIFQICESTTGYVWGLIFIVVLIRAILVSSLLNLLLMILLQKHQE